MDENYLDNLLKSVDKNEEIEVDSMNADKDIIDDLSVDLEDIDFDDLPDIDMEESNLGKLDSLEDIDALFEFADNSFMSKKNSQESNNENISNNEDNISNIISTQELENHKEYIDSDMEANENNVSEEDTSFSDTFFNEFNGEDNNANNIKEDDNSNKHLDTEKSSNVRMNNSVLHKENIKEDIKEEPPALDGVLDNFDFNFDDIEDVPDNANSNSIQDNNDGEENLDSFFSEFESSLDEGNVGSEAFSEPKQQETPSEEPAINSKEEFFDTSEMDDLFNLLGMNGDDEVVGEGSIPIQPDQIYSDNLMDIVNLDNDEELNKLLGQIEEKKEPKKEKKSLKEIIFGVEDEEEKKENQEEKELAQKKKEIRAAKKEEQKAKNEAKKAQANLSSTNKKKTKDDKKKAKKAAEIAENANAEPEKKLNKAGVIIILGVFLAFAAIVILGTNSFSYTLAITKASNYFDRQKYGQAYDQIVGVDVKEKDQPLEDKIYAVMYVERQYESYDIYMKIGSPDKALNALLIGLTKYDEYYSEAVELDITADIDYSYSKIQYALKETFGLTLEEAKEINNLDDNRYAAAVESCAATVEISGEE